MKFARCPSPAWEADDFSRCFQLDYLQTLFPLIVVGASFLYLSIQVLRTVLESRRHTGYRRLSTADDTNWVASHLENAQASPPYQGSDDDTEDDEDAFARNEFLALQPTRSKTADSFVEVDKPRGEVLLVVIEELAVLSEVGLHLAALVAGTWGHRGRVAAVADLVVWLYVAAIASLRLLFSSWSRASFPKLWYHTAFIYGFMWIFTVILFRSEIVHPRSSLARGLTIADFALVTLLGLVALTSRKGNRPVELEHEGELEPSKEQTASVLSLATFSWVDAIVWKGYMKTYELPDVWNLAPKDKAARVLADYRQIKKTTRLTWHLLGYFRRGLILQALWAGFSGLLIFVPTLLLKAILEYVERPEHVPRNAAWLYVILLFVSGCVSALADGQALWLGRKICIRLRAVIIGEIYTKALKRRVSAPSEKTLGESKPEQAQGGKMEKLKRAMSFGRKKKSADVKPAADAQVTSGAIINLMAVDSFKLSEICAYLHFLWASTPVQIVVAVALLYRILGYSSVAGIGMMALLLPINMFVSRQFAVIQKKILAATDARIHTTNEVLSNIRIIKYFAWEHRFISQVNEKRSIELMHLRRRYVWWAIAATIWSGAPILISFLSFLVYTTVEHKDLVPSVAFTALSLFQILRIPMDQLADMVAHVQESKVSVDRIEEYLGEPDTMKYQQIQNELDDDGEPLIGFDNATFTWGGIDSHNDESPPFKMIGLDVRFHVGQLNVVVGATGSGKTSLLLALLGEMTMLDGSVYLPGNRSREDLRPDPETGLIESVAYCAQQAWLVNDTIKENIVFASPWDEKRYRNVIVACSLQRDLEILEAGDQTLVGEKGVTLSGGQKQRISLARALYSRARHVLLDDVLSAVDSHTAKWIFDQCLLGPLMYNRTCVLVTHNVALALPHSNYAVVLDNGRVVAQGTPTEVIDSGKLTEDLSKSRPTSAGPSTVPSRVPSSVGGEEYLGEAISHQTNGSNGKPRPPQAEDDANDGLANGKGGKFEDTRKETKAEGSVKFSIIFLYLKAMGPWWFWILAAITFGAQQLSSVATNVWIREWANQYVTRQMGTLDVHSASISHVGTLSGLGSCLKSGSCVWNMPFWSTEASMDGAIHTADAHEVNAAYYLGIYAALGVIYMLVTLSREGVLFGGSLSASRKIHQRLIEAVTHAKFRFFDSTPLGQLMNRFSKDIESVDQEIAPVAVGVVHCLASIVTIVVLISVITPGFLIAGVFISILYFLIGKFYINSSRDLKRLESVQRSPLYQQFGETLSGMTTIRAYGDERRFVRENLTRINTHNRPFIYLWAANRWLAFRVDVVGAMVSFFAGVFVLLSVGKIDAGAAGLAMTYAVTFTENVLWFVRLYASNEQNMNSVERIKEYLDVEQEAAPIVPENRPPSNWPDRGSVEFVNYSTRYRKDFDLVLKKITFKIEPGEKVGVVGRTGAGKSSLALALFRALEAEEGKIFVDDIDIGLIGLQDLRENIVMVPQDPTLFTGTIRSNLDPFGIFTDEEIFTALRRVQLVGAATSSTASPSSPATPLNETAPDDGPSKPSASATVTFTDAESPDAASSQTPDVLTSDNKNPFRTLTSPVSESGGNLSQGQRQLLCLARALLTSPTVLLMDEATASIDYATDAKIQRTIRQLRNTTVTIAHRLQTIIDYDKVLVLDRGEVVEFGDPFELVGREGGMFRGMCEMTGDLEALVGEARRAWERRRGGGVDVS
ncbi:ABC transporter type 1, transmembrane domain-containing protein [Lineolata rhizophorae]|uniref:ABC transporter type 1, transmembrane domain-containing protein n=1 Tax=Lineolata rhizophorae TaxID=578093 RepID=A0A6A6P0E2_9PEZI|nr:ABC transporter type 1, transmembrane domain-containing protein [Lineolata rhizophorae]